MMIYVIVRTLIPLYLVMMVLQWISMLADLVFQKKKRKGKDFALRFFVSLVWPLALVNRNGRSIFINSFNKIIN